MRETELIIGPVRLTPAAVDDVVRGRLPGAYALGRMREGSFVVKYVGRDDADVRAALRAHAEQGRYQIFAFDYFSTAERAFERECAIYHDFGRWWLLDNRRHPQPSQGTDWACPRCRRAPSALLLPSGLRISTTRQWKSVKL